MPADRPHANNIPLNVDGPRGAVAIVKSDSENLTTNVRGLWIAVGGDLVVTFEGMADGSSQLVRNVPGGAYWTGFVKRVWDTGTTADIDFGVI